VQDIKTDNDVLWGTEEIGEEIRRGRRQTRYLLATGKIKSAKKVGHQWTAVRGELRKEMTQRHEFSAPEREGL
jgi:hypothetical protein